jgi:hypothetical protein
VRNLLRTITASAKNHIDNIGANTEEIEQEQQFLLLYWTKPGEQLPYT